MAVKSYFLDTNVFVQYARGGKVGAWIENEFALQDSANRPLTSVIVWGEVLAIAKRSNWGAKKLDFVDQMLRNCVVVNIGHNEVVEAYSEIMNYSNAVGKSLNKNQNDAWIAASCSVARGHLLTTDKDFKHLSPKFFSQNYIDQESIMGG